MLSRGFSLLEILVAIVITGVIILAVTSVDITSRRFFGSASSQSQIQDEAKIAMGHITRNIQLGIGDMTNPGNMGDDPSTVNSSRGFYILDVSGNLAAIGARIQVKQDDPANPNGKYGDAGDPFIEYEYRDTEDLIRFYPDPTVADRDDPNNFEVFADGKLYSADFRFDDTEPALANRVEVTIVTREDVNSEPSLENPETTLTSSVVLRAMSTN